jgi:hypothetical protein
MTVMATALADAALRMMERNMQAELVAHADIRLGE